MNKWRLRFVECVCSLSCIVTCLFIPSNSCRQFAETIEIPKYCKAKTKSSFLKWLQLIIVGVRLWLHAIFFSRTSNYIIWKLWKEKEKNVCHAAIIWRGGEKEKKNWKSFPHVRLHNETIIDFFLFVFIEITIFPYGFIISGSRNKILCQTRTQNTAHEAKKKLERKNKDEAAEKLLYFKQYWISNRKVLLLLNQQHVNCDDYTVENHH